MEEIVIEIKTVYGKQLIYPVCNNALAFARIAKTKTFSYNNLYDIMSLGFIVKLLVNNEIREIVSNIKNLFKDD